MRCPLDAEKAVKKADRDVRDVVVLRCRARCTNLKDREGFLEKATEAYDGQLDKEIRAQLLLAYHKDPKNKERGFVSNNQVAAERRGGPRPRRRRKSKKDSESDAEEHEHDEDARGSACPAAIRGDAGARQAPPKKKSGKKAAKHPADVPKYVDVPRHQPPLAMTPAHVTTCRLEAASRRRYLVLAELKDILVYRDDDALPESYGEYLDFEEGYRCYFRPWVEELVGELLQESMCASLPSCRRFLPDVRCSSCRPCCRVLALASGR